MLEVIFILAFHEIHHLSLPSAIKHSPTVRQSNTADISPNDTMTHNAGNSGVGDDKLCLSKQIMFGHNFGRYDS